MTSNWSEEFPLNPETRSGAVNRAESDIDVVVRDRFFPRTASGLFVEVGAARPDFLSISALYRSLGWKVLSIEPNLSYAPIYADRGLEVLPYACGPEDKDDVDFCVVDSHGATYEGGQVSFEAWSSFSIKPDYANLNPDLDVSHIKVAMRRLDTIMQNHAPGVGAFDIISIDVEGWELEVLDGLTFSKHPPKVLVIENLFLEERYRNYMRTRGYILWRCLPPNEIYIRDGMIGSAERVTCSLMNAVVTSAWRARKAIRKLVKG